MDQLHTKTDGLISNTVLAIATDSAGNIWCGTDAGISRFDGTFWTNYTTADGLLSNNVRAVVIDSSGSKWFAAFWWRHQ